MGPLRVAWAAGSCQMHSFAEGSVPGHPRDSPPVSPLDQTSLLQELREDNNVACLSLCETEAIGRDCAFYSGHHMCAAPLCSSPPPHLVRGLTRAAGSAGLCLLPSPEGARGPVTQSLLLVLLAAGVGGSVPCPTLPTQRMPELRPPQHGAAVGTWNWGASGYVPAGGHLFYF